MDRNGERDRLLCFSEEKQQDVVLSNLSNARPTFLISGTADLIGDAILETLYAEIPRWGMV